MSGRIRLRYSTTLNYLSMLFKVAVSLAFTVVVARKLTVKEYGLWGVILSLSAVALSPISFWNFWAVRWHARGRVGAGITGLVVTAIYGLAATAMVAAVGFVSPRLFMLDDMRIFLLAAPIAALTCLQSYMLSLSRVVKPEVLGYTNILYDALRLTLVSVLLLVYGAGLLGVVVAVEISLLMSDIYLAYMLAANGGFRGSFRLGMVGEWVRLSPIPALNMAVNSLRGGLRAFLAYLTGSPLETSYLNVSITVETPFVRASAAATPALYARLLEGKGGGGDLEESMSIIALFTGFTAALILAAPRGVLGLFGHNYEAASLVLQLVTIYAVMQGFSSIFEASLLGFEKADRRGGVKLSSLAGSLLVKVPAAKLFSYLAVYAATLSAALLGEDPYTVLLVLAFMLAASRVPLIAWMYYSVKKALNFKHPRDPLLPVLASSTATSAYLLLVGANTVYSHTFVSQLFFLLRHAAVGLALYLALLYLMSRWFRGFARAAAAYMFSSLRWPRYC